MCYAIRYVTICCPNKIRFLTRGMRHANAIKTSKSMEIYCGASIGANANVNVNANVNANTANESVPVLIGGNANVANESVSLPIGANANAMELTKDVDVL